MCTYKDYHITCIGLSDYEMVLQCIEEMSSDTLGTNKCQLAPWCLQYWTPQPVPHRGLHQRVATGWDCYNPWHPTLEFRIPSSGNLGVVSSDRKRKRERGRKRQREGGREGEIKRQRESLGEKGGKREA